jgi:hypothetical protein
VAYACCYVIWCDCIYFIKYIFAADYLAVCYRWDSCGQRSKKVYASLLSMKYDQLPNKIKKTYSTQESRMISFWNLKYCIGPSLSACSSTYKFAIWVSKNFSIILIWVNNYDFIYMVTNFEALVGLLLGYKSITLTFMLVSWADRWYCQTPSWARNPNQLNSSSGLALCSKFLPVSDLPNCRAKFIERMRRQWTILCLHPGYWHPHGRCCLRN